MKVFICYARSQYGFCGGMIIVSGKDLDEAYNTYASDNSFEYQHYDGLYPKHKWFEATDLKATTDVSRVLYEDSHQE